MRNELTELREEVQELRLRNRDLAKDAARKEELVDQDTLGA